MRKTLRVLASALLLAFSACLALPAQAETDWRGAYLKVLKGGQGQKRMAALIDLDMDKTPELALITINKAQSARLSVYTLSGGEAVLMKTSASYFDLDSFALENVKSANFQMRVSPDGAPCLSVQLGAVIDGYQANLRACLAYESGKTLRPVYVARKSASAKFTVNGDSVSESKLESAEKEFESEYKKKGTLPTQTLAASYSASSISSKFKSLAKRYAAFSTVKKIKLSETEAVMAPGQTATLRAAITPATAVTDQITWASSDESVASVKDGEVTAKAAGIAEISATAKSGLKKICRVKVTGESASLISLDEVALTLVKGASYTLSATANPANASLVWRSSNPTVATVEQDGTVRALKVGKAVITVKNGSKSAACKVVVNEKNGMIVDISQHNYSAKMDWAKIAKNVDLLILRCGVTRTETAPIGVGIDAKFATYAKLCKEYGIPFGVYFYGKCSDVETAQEEARLTWETASPYSPLFYVYDVEESRLNKTLIETYMNTLKSLGAKKTGYYIAHHLYAKYKLDTSLVDFIWLPHYGANTGKVVSTPSFPCDIHQYSSQGRVEGFPGVVDVNRLMGGKSMAWFLSR